MATSASLESTLRRLECPFVWNVSKNILLINFDKKELHEEDPISLNKVMKMISKIYFQVEKGQIMEAVDDLKVITAFWSNQDHKNLENESISLAVVDHILDATKCHVFLKRGLIDEAEDVMKQIKTFDYNELKNISTLNGCKCLLYSSFFSVMMNDAIKFAKLAIKDGPKCGLWHFILGQNLRRLRRISTGILVPTQEETNSLQKAYELAKIPKFGIFLATSYREARNYTRSKALYLEVYQQRPKCCKIQLRLALYFIRSKELPLAKQCLLYVEKQLKTSENSMFLHYFGIYYEQKKDYKMAAQYLKRAAAFKNYGADIQYARCMMKIDQTFNLLQHFLDMLLSYTLLGNYQRQVLLMYIATEYHKRGLFENTVTYVLHSVEIDPQAENLKVHRDFMSGRMQNIYSFIDYDLLPKIFKDGKKYSEEIVSKAKKLQDYSACHNRLPTNCRNLMEKLTI